MELMEPPSNGTAHALRADQCAPETLSGRYLRRFWIPLAMLDDCVPGRARPLTMMGQAFTYYRGASGEPHLVGALCAHRNVALALGWVEGDALRCLYHGWTYDGSGQCIQQPAEADSYAKKVRIPSYPLRVLHGIVFAYLGDGEPPPFPRVAALERAKTVLPSSYVRKTNYLNAIENNADWIHLNFVHARSSFADRGATRELPTITAEETPFGVAGWCTYSDGKQTRFNLLMPHASYLAVVHPDLSEVAGHLAWRVPIDDHSHRSFILTLLQAEGAELERYLDRRREQARVQAQLPPQDEIVDAILRGDLHVDEVDADRPDLVGIQDSAVMHTQPPPGGREPDRLGVTDIAIIKLRRLWLRELEALADGRPTTAWDWSGDDLVATLGVE